jgi:hypothetical protein
MSGCDVSTIEPFEDEMKLDLPAGQVSGCCQTVEIIDIERGELVGAAESLIRLLPRATYVAVTAVFEIVHLNQA